MSTIFTKIINGEIPCYKIAENNTFFAFLDVYPLVAGHVLVVPKVEVDYIFDVNDSILAQWLVFAKPIAKAMKIAFPCKRIGISVQGLEVPHAHMHLVPINASADLNFSRPKLTMSREEFVEVQNKILACL